MLLRLLLRVSVVAGLCNNYCRIPRLLPFKGQSACTNCWYTDNRLTFFNLSTFIPTRFLIFQCCFFRPGLPLSTSVSEDKLAALCKRFSARCFIFFALDIRKLQPVGWRVNPFTEGNEDLKL